MTPHNTSQEELLKELQTSAAGLSSQEARQRLERYGENKLAEKRKKTNLQRFLDQFKDVMILILLLAAALWVRSSPRLYEWLLAHRCFGGYIRNFRENRAIPLRAKVVSIALMWGTMLYCIFGLLDGRWWAQVGLLAVAVGVTWHILSFATLRK